MKVDRCRGFRDLSPEEMARFRLIEGVFRDCCLKSGYQEIRTPTLEYLYLFTSVGTLTPAMLGRVYSFLDWDGWSGERVVLKPDGTIPVARLYIESLKRGLARLFYVTNIFMFEETGKKSRERWQCGAELIGASSVLADVELVALALDVLQGLGLEGVKVKLSHAGLVKTVLSSLELAPQEQSRIFDQILDGDIEVLARIKPDKPELVAALSLLLGLKGRSPGFLKNIKALFLPKLPQFKPALDSFIGIVDLLEALGYDCQIDLASGKGFEYYTGAIFHLYIGQEIVGGGGRYDALIPLMGGRDTPAAGFAFYLEPLMTLLKPEALVEPVTNRILVRFAQEAVKEGFSVASRLREAGYAAEVHLGGQEPANLRWTIDVHNKAPLFVLTDRVNNERFELRTADEVLATLLEKGGVEMRLLPIVETLQEAVIRVIESNKNDGYLPTRFIQITQEGYAPDLPVICDRLITKGETLEWLESALRRFPTLLTLEDFVALHGLLWGFSQSTVGMAKARASYFDQIAGIKRYQVLKITQTRRQDI